MRVMLTPYVLVQYRRNAHSFPKPTRRLIQPGLLATSAFNSSSRIVTQHFRANVVELVCRLQGLHLDILFPVPRSSPCRSCDHNRATCLPRAPPVVVSSSIGNRPVSASTRRRYSVNLSNIRPGYPSSPPSPSISAFTSPPSCPGSSPDDGLSAPSMKNISLAAS
jgi:hypothetical protein